MPNPVYSEGHCPHKAAPGGCRLHNIQCRYPDCDLKLEREETATAALAELLSCPFCNGPARLHGPDWTSHHWHDVYVECVGDCGAQGEKFNIHMDDMEDPPARVIEWAIAAWNRRADDHYFAAGENKMTLDLDALAELARKATPGPWIRSGIQQRMTEKSLGAGPDGRLLFFSPLGATNNDHAQCIRDMDFIAALDPTTVLALIDLARRTALYAHPSEQGEAVAWRLLSRNGVAGSIFDNEEQARAIAKDFSGSVVQPLYIHPAPTSGIHKAVTLVECPVGLFRAESGELCLKTQYVNNEGRIEAYIVNSGEFFWGNAPQTIASQRAQMVIPVD